MKKRKTKQGKLVGTRKREKGAIKGHALKRRGRSNQDTEEITYLENKYPFY